MLSPVTLPGSFREHPINSVSLGKPASDEIIRITLLVRRRSEAPEDFGAENQLSHDELAARHGADPSALESIQKFASDHNFPIVKTHVGSRCVTISGKCSELAETFGADIELHQVDGAILRTRRGQIRLPESLKDSVVGVLGFDERPAAATSHRVHRRATQPGSFTPPQLAQIYNFPKNTGAGQTIAILELGGGYAETDLQTYWQRLGLKNVSVAPVSVDGAQNAPTGDPNGPDGEVVLDIEVAGAVAPEANIVVYFAANTDQGFLDAINTAIHDTVRKPSVISISWGAAEKEWTPQVMDAFNAAFHDAALLGITVLVAAGDNGSSDGEKSGKHVDFPASSPWVIACGGTRLVAANNQIKTETVWNDGTQGGSTGGGVSTYFSQPTYQSAAGVPAPPTRGGNKTGRGVPDIAAVADPETGYEIFLDGQATVIGGTSAVAPLWAGLVALFNQELGRNVGWLNPTLYGTIAAKKLCHDVTSGTNGGYQAKVGWDCCTGWGTPNGQAILNLLKK